MVQFLEGDGRWGEQNPFKSYFKKWVYLRFVEVNVNGLWWFKKLSWWKGDLGMKMKLGSWVGESGMKLMGCWSYLRKKKWKEYISK